MFDSDGKKKGEKLSRKANRKKEVFSPVSKSM